jgi:hypothetical protein
MAGSMSTDPSEQGAPMPAVAAAVDAGLPLLTVAGDTHARRTAASVLIALETHQARSLPARPLARRAAWGGRARKESRGAPVAS